MDDDKEDKSLFQKAIETVKEVASSVTEVIASAPPSQRAEPAPEENFDAPPMTAEELAEHAAAVRNHLRKTHRLPRTYPAASRQPMTSRSPTLRCLLQRSGRR
jgi:hypothetical protein